MSNFCKCGHHWGLHQVEWHDGGKRSCLSCSCHDFVQEDEEKGNVMDKLFATLLNALIDYAKKRRNDAHNSAASLDRKRSLATVVTKLEEAQMWDERAEREKSLV